MIFGNIHLFPIFMELTLHRQKTPFSYFNVSGTQTSTKSPGNLRASIFGRKKDYGKRKQANGGPRAKRRWPTRPQYQAAWDPLVRASWLRCLRSLLHRHRLDLKTPIKKVPRRSLEGAPHKHRNTETEIRSCRLEGENSGGALPAWSPSSPTTSPPSPWWRGSSPPLDYGFVEVTYVSLLSWASLISTVWAAEHDYGHRCNTFVVDLYELIYVWDCNVCFSYEYRCILCTPFLSTCFDQACLWERVWGNVCISWSNGGWLVQWTWEKVLRSTLVSLPYFVASLGIN